MSGTKNGNTIKRSVSFSPTVNEWADELARKRGLENNFSGFMAALIHEARERETQKKSGLIVAHVATSRTDAAMNDKSAPPALRPAKPVTYHKTRK